MVIARTNAPEILEMAGRLSEEQEKNRREPLMREDEFVRLINREQKNVKRPELFSLDTMAIVAERGTEQKKTAPERERSALTEFPLLSAFTAGMTFATSVFVIAEVIARCIG